LLSGDVVSRNGNFAGFRGNAEIEQSKATNEERQRGWHSTMRSTVLRSPLDRIIEAPSALERADGPPGAIMPATATISPRRRHLFPCPAEEDPALDKLIDLAALTARPVMIDPRQRAANSIEHETVEGFPQAGRSEVSSSACQPDRQRCVTPHRGPFAGIKQDSRNRIG
jgi:hypothetical protein